MKPVFADTSYYVALLSAADQYHSSAVDWSEHLLGRVVVTEYILVELASALCDPQDRHLVEPFIKHLLGDSSTVFVPASKSLFQQGLDLYATRPDKKWSLVDCISFVVMKKRRLTEALTTDHHFRQAGFRPLLA